MTSKTKSFRADEALLDQLANEADNRGISQNALIVEAIERLFRKPVEIPPSVPVVPLETITEVEKALARWRKR